MDKILPIALLVSLVGIWSSWAASVFALSPKNRTKSLAWYACCFFNILAAIAIALSFSWPFWNFTLFDKISLIFIALLIGAYSLYQAVKFQLYGILSKYPHNTYQCENCLKVMTGPFIEYCDQCGIQFKYWDVHEFGSPVKPK